MSLYADAAWRCVLGVYICSDVHRDLSELVGLQFCQRTECNKETSSCKLSPESSFRHQYLLNKCQT